VTSSTGAPPSSTPDRIPDPRPLPVGVKGDHAGHHSDAPRGWQVMDKSADGPGFFGYGFVSETAIPTTQFVSGVINVPGVRFAGRTVGSSVALVVADVSSLAVLQNEILPAVADYGATTTAWTAAMSTSPMFNTPVKRGTAVVGALVRVRTTHTGQLLDGIADVYSDLNSEELAGHHASALRTFGSDCDVLLDIGAPTQDHLFDHLARIDQLPAVTTYVVALAHWVDNAVRSDD
jgi:hypothetical protein